MFPHVMALDTTRTTTSARSRSGLRWLTCLALIASCGFTAIRGVSIAQFAEQRAHILSNASAAGGVGRWMEVTGLAGAALETALAEKPAASGLDSAHKRAEALAKLLAARPLSSKSWLQLAVMRLVAGEPQKRVLAALFMSSVTGPNEGSIMWQRGVFGLSLWKALAPEARQRTIDDLAGVMRVVSVGDDEMSAAKNILDVKPAETRSAIADLLRAEGISEADLGRMGL
jgi:hypothetical protein